MLRSYVRLRALLESQKGQAMVEYSTITFMILVGGVAATAGVNFPGTNAPFLAAFMNALQLYLNSLYFWIDMPMP